MGLNSNQVVPEDDNAVDGIQRKKPASPGFDCATKLAPHLVGVSWVAIVVWLGVAGFVGYKNYFALGFEDMCVIKDNLMTWGEHCVAKGLPFQSEPDFAYDRRMWSFSFSILLVLVGSPSIPAVCLNHSIKVVILVQLIYFVSMPVIVFENTPALLVLDFSTEVANWVYLGITIAVFLIGLAYTIVGHFVSDPKSCISKMMAKSLWLNSFIAICWFILTIASAFMVAVHTFYTAPGIDIFSTIVQKAGIFWSTMWLYCLLLVPFLGILGFVTGDQLTSLVESNWDHIYMKFKNLLPAEYRRVASLMLHTADLTTIMSIGSDRMIDDLHANKHQRSKFFIALRKRIGSRTLTRRGIKLQLIKQLMREFEAIIDKLGIESLGPQVKEVTALIDTFVIAPVSKIRAAVKTAVEHPNSPLVPVLAWIVEITHDTATEPPTKIMSLIEFRDEVISQPVLLIHWFKAVASELMDFNRTNALEDREKAALNVLLEELAGCGEEVVEEEKKEEEAEDPAVTAEAKITELTVRVAELEAALAALREAEVARLTARVAELEAAEKALAPDSPPNRNSLPPINSL